jgi:hypothetical protein
MVPSLGRLKDGELQILAGSTPGARSDVLTSRVHVNDGRFRNAGAVLAAGATRAIGIHPALVAYASLTARRGRIGTIGIAEALNAAPGRRVTNTGIIESRALR